MNLAEMENVVSKAFSDEFPDAVLVGVAVNHARNSDGIDVIWVDIEYNGGSVPLDAEKMQDVVDVVWSAAGDELSPVVSFASKEAERLEAAE